MKKENIQKYLPKDADVELHGNAAVFEVPASSIKEIAVDLRINNDLPLKLITATDDMKDEGCFKIWYVFGVPRENAFIVPFIRLKGSGEFPSLSKIFRGALKYERKIKAFFGLVPVDHPDPRQIILHENWPPEIHPLKKTVDGKMRPKEAHEAYQFQKVHGEGIYEIPVGPIHAGIIEPGHFRFSVAGEEIILLEPRLGFTHKGSEKLFESLPLGEMIRLSEKISGDSSFSHSLAFCQAVECLQDVYSPKRAKCLRVIFAELERLANHLGDIGAIMLDTGFNFGGAQCARLREMVMQMNELLTGSRFLRGVNAVGGVTKDISGKYANKLSGTLSIILKDLVKVIGVANNSASLLNRLFDTGTLSHEVAKQCEAIGVAAKAVGIEHDARIDFPYAAYDETSLNQVATEKSGDVFARFRVRVAEAHASIDIIGQMISKLPEGPICEHARGSSFKKNALSISIVEGWRGDILYFIATDGEGNINRVVPRDPSFINWSLLGEAGPGNIVPDFPLINKSFNLSYSGNDL